MKQSILLISLFITSFTFGQVEYIELDKESMSKRKFFDDISVGFSVNHSLLKGDAYGLSNSFINDDFELNGEDQFDLGFGIRVSKQLSRMFDLGLEFNVSNMTGVKEHVNNAPYNTRATDIDYYNFNLTSRFYFSKYITHKTRRPAVLGYLDAAAGLLISEATTINANDQLPNYDDQKRIDDENSLVVGLGGGIEVRVFDKLSIDLGTKIFYSNSDKVDGIYVSDFDQTDQNDYNDVFWISHIGANFDLAREVDNSISKKWHMGSLRTESILDTVVQIDTVFVPTVDTLIIVEVDTVVEEAPELVVLTPVYFDTESSLVKMDQLAAIEKAAEFLREHPDAILTLNGFTDERGTDGYNMALSERRVKAVEKVLINIYKIDHWRLKSSFHGENHMKLDQDGLNRRVDLFIK